MASNRPSAPQSDFYKSLADILAKHSASDRDPARATDSERSDHVAAFNALAGEKGWPIRFEDAQVFGHKQLNDLLAIWKERTQGNIGARSQFDAKTLKPFLPNVTIIERTGDGADRRYRFRLVGTEIARAFGDRTGEVLDDVVPSEFAERWTAGYDTVLNAKRPLRSVAQFTLPEVNYLDGETFFAPLQSDEGEIDLILSATYMSSRNGE